VALGYDEVGCLMNFKQSAYLRPTILSEKVRSISIATSSKYFTNRKTDSSQYLTQCFGLHGLRHPLQTGGDNGPDRSITENEIVSFKHRLVRMAIDFEAFPELSPTSVE
jgi:hypothetical protein